MTSEITIVPVLPEETRNWWPLAEEWLSKPLKRSKGLLTDESVIDAASKGLMQVWLACDRIGDFHGAIVTEIRNLSTGIKTVHILAAGARSLAVKDATEGELIEWAESVGADKITADARPGLARKMPNWRAVSVLMEKEIVRRR